MGFEERAIAGGQNGDARDGRPERTDGGLDFDTGAGCLDTRCGPG
jgi:hypothetical protein